MKIVKQIASFPLLLLHSSALLCAIGALTSVGQLCWMKSNAVLHYLSAFRDSIESIELSAALLVFAAGVIYLDSRTRS